MAELSLVNVVNISVSQAQAGAGEYNTSNLCIFSDEAYDVDLFGALGYKIYLSPKEVGQDFGTASKTFAMANAVFSQQPNILAGNGYLVIIPFVTAEQHLVLSGVPASGSFTLTYLGNPTAALLWNDSASAIQAKLQAVAGLESVVVGGSLASLLLTISFKGVYGVVPVLTVGGTGLMTSAPAAITITPSTTQAGEKYADAISRTEDLVQYFGCIPSVLIPEADGIAAAAVVQAINKIAGVVSQTPADFAPDGYLDLIQQEGESKMRCLYYGRGEAVDALVMMAAYFGRGLSTNFSGSNTTSTMHLKDLIGVLPDSTMTQTYLNQCQTAGVDVYVSLQGIPKVFCSGANSFFDQVYNLAWFVGALQIAGFNYLATAATKIPQTEDGMDGLKGAYRNVCEQGITNQYGAPGKWTRPDTFGNQVDFLANISQVGYYIFSTPISKQSQTDRAGRKAPLVQIAFKEAGAIHSSNVLVSINA